MKKNGCQVEVLLSKLGEQGKTGIKLPLRQNEYDEFESFAISLLKKNLLSKQTFIEALEEEKSRTLDDETYELFYECLKK